MNLTINKKDIPKHLLKFFKPKTVYKPKDDAMIPHRVYSALMNDGWYGRSGLPWIKRNSMPEAATDRPASALEYMFLLTKSSKYFFDMDAIRIKGPQLGHYRKDGRSGSPNSETTLTNQKMVNPGFREKFDNPNGRNFRNTDIFYQSLEEPHGAIFAGDEMVGLDVNPQAYKDAHFATFPEKLASICIKAGSSEKGCCSECFAPWQRIVEKKRIRRNELDRSDPRYRPNQYSGAYEDINGKGDAGYSESKTIGWEPSCKCGHKETVPCVVLDPFGGSGTTKNVADRLGRHGVMCELKMEYIEMAKKRCYQEPGLF